MNNPELNSSEQREAAVMRQIRVEYGWGVLREASVPDDPWVLFTEWFNTAVDDHLHEPNGMTLATSTPEGRPSARIVLLKGYDPEGFVFYTNYQSRKGQEMAANGGAALVFWWGPHERQVRVEGQVAPISAAESDAYFASRPRSSQLGAWVSAQSTTIHGREPLDQRGQALQAHYGDSQPIPRPPHWGGYRLVPDRMEFWQGQASRLHDRFFYEWQPATDTWHHTRLAP